jgi:hypothetical protein
VTERPTKLDRALRISAVFCVVSLIKGPGSVLRKFGVNEITRKTGPVEQKKRVFRSNLRATWYGFDLSGASVGRGVLFFRSNNYYYIAGSHYPRLHPPIPFSPFKRSENNSIRPLSRKVHERITSGAFVVAGKKC